MPGEESKSEMSETQRPVYWHGSSEDFGTSKHGFIHKYSFFEYIFIIHLFFPASVIVLINPLAAIIAGFVMDAIGRLNLLRLATLPTIVGWVLIATSVNVPMILIGRLFVGFGSSKKKSQKI